jgi:hypothetical protein
MPRGLHPSFMSALKDSGGALRWVLERVHEDHSLCLEIRENYVNVYYRGGSLLKITANDNCSRPYNITFDQEYLRGGACLPKPGDLAGWREGIPLLKDSMDRWLGAHPKLEREYQQLVVRDNNRPEENSTDYFICDIEYDNRQGARFDMVAAHWPSTSLARKDNNAVPLALIEMKHGDGALCGRNGLASHLRDIAAFVGDSAGLGAFKSEILTVFNQKRELGLLNCKKRIQSFSEKPAVLFLLVNHDPAKSALGRGFNECRPKVDELSRNGVRVGFITASCCGYGIYDQHVVDWNEFTASIGFDARGC